MYINFIASLSFLYGNEIMESSSMVAPKFRFRDHSLPESQNLVQHHSSEASSDDIVSALSVSTTDPDGDDDQLHIESITGRGIKHLCDELRELKEAASLDLHKNIYAKFSSFLRILEDVTDVENELLQLENHLESHKRLLNDLTGRIYPNILSINSYFEDHIDVAPSSPSKLENHINDVSEKLDILISENRIDEALNLLESADEHYQNIQQEDCSQSEIELYNTVISEKKSMLIQQLTHVAESRRTSGPELQRALVGLRTLGDTQHAIHLLLKHYHFRIVTGTSNFTKSSSDEMYVKEFARFVFSMISQAARSYAMLCGETETSPYASEFVFWSHEETKSFVTCFEKYVKGNSAISVGLSSAIKAVSFAVMYCSLLENQKLELRPFLVRHLCPCMEEVLNTHVNHFKKVVGIFSESDAWILEKYLVSGVFGGDSSSTLAVEEQPHYCLLTTSGRKVLTLLQAIVEDISPLVTLEMGSIVISGLKNLFKEYITILERALTCETNTTEQASPRIKLAESLPQEVSILANLSTLVQFLFTMVKSIFSNTGHMDSSQELDGFLLFIEEGYNKLRNVFCQQLILKVVSTYHSHENFSAIQCNDQFGANTAHNLIPSGIFQNFFLELRKIEQLDQENVFDVHWLMGLLRELMESMFIWVSKNKEILATTEENISLQQTDETNQFILDVQFLVEIGMYGGYFTNDPLLLLTLMKSTFNSAGLDPFKDVDSDDWAIDAATKTIQKLLETERRYIHSKEPTITIQEELHEHENQIIFSEEDEINSSEISIDTIDAEEDEVAKDDSDQSEVAIDAKTASLNIVDTNTLNLRQPSISTVQLENSGFEKAIEVQTDDELAPSTSSKSVDE